MNFTTLVSQLDQHNEEIVLLVKKFNIKTLIIIYLKDEKKQIKDIDIAYKTIIPNCNITYEEIKLGDIESIRDVIKKNTGALINFAGGSRINSLILLKLAMESNMQGIYVDMANKIRYVFTEDYRVINNQLNDMNIEEIISLAGAKIIEEGSSLCKKEEIIAITNAILDNLPTWHKYKYRLYDNDTFIHNYKDNSKLTINKKKLNNEESSLIRQCLQYLKNIDGIRYSEDTESVQVLFNNYYLKGFLFKSGTWLEVVTHFEINKIKSIDESKSGVSFIWNTEENRVMNELDVIAVKDNVLICISCKDSQRYDEDALNELQVYSERLGGKDTIKILVATKPPIKKCVIDRAKEMGIHIVIIEKDRNAFRKKLQLIIENKT